ncbi:MAG: hypothetical protein GX418_07805 [Clostridiales bacterium]|nr:hypothetical protein [Clostridiales bacterium]
MSGISVDVSVLLIKGIPEGLLVAWAIHLFTNTPLQFKKYALLSLFYIVTTYLIRFLPITLGINTVLSLFVLTFAFQVVYKAGLNQVIRAVISSVVVLILIAVSEVLNVVLLTVIFGRSQAEALFTSTDGLTRAVYSSPSTIFMAMFLVLIYFILRYIRMKRNLGHGKDYTQAS